MSGAYDERLLASAPVATRAEKQARIPLRRLTLEGYNIDLLDEHRAAPRSVSRTPPPVPTLAANHAKAEEGAGGYTYGAYAAPLPWYKTRKWILIMALGAVLVIAAVVGGAVGGTVGHKNTVAAAADSGGGGAVGPAVSQNADDPGQAATRSSEQQTATSTSTANGGGGGGLGNELTQSSPTSTTNADPSSHHS
ncbi:hypothetical protein C2E23DRAFT_893058 [Lenzites betulinus]|nr:hypothetical protein C2E23DRAFT_893058 [Lenzites betulinus]